MEHLLVVFEIAVAVQKNNRRLETPY